ncbi:aminoglycoside phosphotransferase family protein [Psychrobacillus sp. INOP01]|uniref:aminoglycoside phosphotransferase family protein n=1 Tax=Psychrobacillus sp. INOP01 TaxID=2829187 RepID=UPI001BABF770|nr:aminoglycoside phosphotransferase family protein [Psychrobacillus sp. INOP01]QUG42891.1 aminoglycoside phosphotransferase family protein [Psychrobacillus sp. INOP01]
MDLGAPIAIGNTAKIYLVQNMAIKIFNESLPKTESTYEANKQKLAYSCGLPVPKVIDVTEIDGKQAIVMEYIKGKTLGSMLLENMEIAEYYMEIFIDVQQQIHMIVPSSLEPMSQKLRLQIESAPILDQRQKYKLMNRLELLTYEKRLCHGDFHPFNLVMSDKNITIIDWVDASAGDIRADIYRTYLLYSQFSTELAEIYLQLYCKRSGLSKEEVFEWAPIIAGARLSETVSSENSQRLIEIINRYCPQ